jgi:hypothetical protein
MRPKLAKRKRAYNDEKVTLANRFLSFSWENLSLAYSFFFIAYGAAVNDIVMNGEKEGASSQRTSSKTNAAKTYCGVLWRDACALRAHPELHAASAAGCRAPQPSN